VSLRALLASLVVGFVLPAACGGDSGGAGALPGAGGEASRGDAGAASNDGVAAGAPPSSNGGGTDDAAGASSTEGGETSGSGGSSTGMASKLYVPPSEIIGARCQGTPNLPSPPCAFAPEQVYCHKDDTSRGIMAACSAAGRSQCEVMDECQVGWHACTATDYVARGGRDIAPSLSSATDTAWLAACVRDFDGNALKNEACSRCGQDPGYAPSIEWWCDGKVVYEGGMEGDTLGVVASPECMRVGSNLASHGAFWTMAFSDGAPSFVMCCLDQP
jgi:hypothetical protein